MLGSMQALLQRDIALARSQGGGLGAALGFILAVMVLVPLALGPDQPFTSRLKDTGGLTKKNRITHKVGIEKAEDIDVEVESWLRAAYERDTGV